MFCKKKIKESTRHFFLLQHLPRFLHCLSFTLKAGGRATVEGRGFPLPPSSWLFPAFRYQVADASREQCETARLQLDSRWCTWGLEHFWLGDHGNSENVGRKLRQPPKIQLLRHSRHSLAFSCLFSTMRWVHQGNTGLVFSDVSVSAWVLCELRVHLLGCKSQPNSFPQRMDCSPSTKKPTSQASQKKHIFEDMLAYILF